MLISFPIYLFLFILLALKKIPRSCSVTVLVSILGSEVKTGLRVVKWNLLSMCPLMSDGLQKGFGILPFFIWIVLR